jgi:hypothetical protein
LLLFDSIQIINYVEKSFETRRGQIVLKIQSKLKNVLEKNNGLTLLKNISRMLSGTGVIEGLNGFPEDISSRDIPYSKYAPITSVDVER